MEDLWVGHFPLHVAMRCIDLVLVDGTRALVRLCVAFLWSLESELLACEGAPDVLAGTKISHFRY